MEAVGERLDAMVPAEHLYAEGAAGAATVDEQVFRCQVGGGQLVLVRVCGQPIDTPGRDDLPVSTGAGDRTEWRCAGGQDMRPAHVHGKQSSR